MGIKKITDRRGKQFNQLTIVSLPKKLGYGRYIVKCQCKFGIKLWVREDHIIEGHTKSCGHLLIASVTTHGFSHSSNKIERKFYKAWNSMFERCRNPNSYGYIHYGGRGIIICERWASFENFKADMWDNYLKHIIEFGIKNTSLDRKDPNGNYEPSNCRWATDKVQSNNKRNNPQSNNIQVHRFFIKSFSSELFRVIKNNRTASNSKYLKYLGCTVEEFIQYFESLFEFGMSWDNHGRNKKGQKIWQLEHIRPCYTFDLSKEQDRKICFNYKNLRPMWWKDNANKRTQDLKKYKFEKEVMQNGI